MRGGEVGLVVEEAVVEWVAREDAGEAEADASAGDTAGGAGRACCGVFGASERAVCAVEAGRLVEEILEPVEGLLGREGVAVAEEG